MTTSLINIPVFLKLNWYYLNFVTQIQNYILVVFILSHIGFLLFREQ
ncbi:hypothetical protein NO004_250155 [Flavobacterium psychrophilum]|nr:hypothetical protein FI146_390005 [Flavobacterium psychrophilum]SNB14623.1 hypothetical protein IT2_430416 [Flavobacterium psychrophilum]SNB25413.1 hypothetical protein NO004_250155 [Flavobacterium psychrophilum]SNB36964.1 hypothetical protein NO042_70085 [Flavobacterium psychrophilum]